MMLRIRLKIIKDYQYVENKYLKLDLSLINNNVAILRKTCFNPGI